MRYIITFESVHYVIKAEKILKKAGINLRLIPPPREISSDCGMAIEILDDIKGIRSLLESKNCVPIGIHKLPEK